MDDLSGPVMDRVVDSQLAECQVQCSFPPVSDSSKRCCQAPSEQTTSLFGSGEWATEEWGLPLCNLIYKHRRKKTLALTHLFVCRYGGVFILLFVRLNLWGQLSYRLFSFKITKQLKTVSCLQKFECCDFRVGLRLQFIFYGQCSKTQPLILTLN